MPFLKCNFEMQFWNAILKYNFGMQFWNTILISVAIFLKLVRWSFLLVQICSPNRPQNLFGGLYVSHVFPDLALGPTFVHFGPPKAPFCGHLAPMLAPKGSIFGSSGSYFWYFGNCPCLLVRGIPMPQLTPKLGHAFYCGKYRCHIFETSRPIAYNNLFFITKFSS